MDGDSQVTTPGLGRRTVLASAAVVAAAGAGATVWAATRGTDDAGPAVSRTPASLHQVGVVTMPPTSAVLTAFDVRATDRAGLDATLRRLSTAITETTSRYAGSGRPVEATVAVGASLFDDRFGLAEHRPRRLVTMPAFPNDVLDPARCHGDLLLQVCAGDAATTRSVLEEITTAGLVTRWRMAGFRDENTVTAHGRASDRNLFGFREGAGNPDVRDTAQMDRLVWAGPGSDEPAWTVGGTYQVVRTIRFATSLWDSEPIPRQEAVFGRRRQDGAPLGRDREDAEFDYASDEAGQLIALDAHIRRANPRTPQTEENRILRRGYSYRGPVDVTGQRDEGMLFICFQQDLERGFATVQRRLAGEALDRYLLPVGGGYYFVLPGRAGTSDDYLGRTLIDASQQ
ncbi:Dyp-type peroxidase [Micromonospora sonneratiae]